MSASNGRGGDSGWAGGAGPLPPGVVGQTARTVHVVPLPTIDLDMCLIDEIRALLVEPAELLLVA